MTRVSLLGLPTDRHSSFLRGPARAPAAIRAALQSSHSHLTASNGLEVGAILRDLGDAPLKEDEGDFDRIVEAARAAFAEGPAVVLGGDHAVTFPVLRGLAAAGRPPPQIVHIDAHPDLYDDLQGAALTHPLSLAA